MNDSNVSYGIETPVFPETGAHSVSVSRYYAFGEVEGPALSVRFVSGNIIVRATNVLVATGDEIAFSSERGYHVAGAKMAEPATLEKLFAEAPKGNAWLKL